jgi:hypothetical protein
MPYTDDPENVPADELRLLIGDTDTTDELLSDAEVDFFLADDGSAIWGAVRACTAVAAKFARKVTSTSGRVSKQLSDLMQHYLDLARRLEQRAEEKSTGLVFTALTRSDKQIDREDADLIQPQFFIGQDDNPRRRSARRNRDEDPFFP